MKKPIRLLFMIGRSCIYGFFLQILFINLLYANPLHVSLKEAPRPMDISSIAIDQTITGTVTDQNGDPVPGVTVSVPGTTVGTATDLDGKYSLMVPEGSTLVFSFIGFASQSIVVAGRSVIDVVLVEDVSSLEEVVVVGYGTQRRSDLTGSVAVVNVKDMKAQPAASPIEGLQGKATGVHIINTGAPGATPQIRIRVLVR